MRHPLPPRALANSAEPHFRKCGLWGKPHFYKCGSRFVPHFMKCETSVAPKRSGWNPPSTRMPKFRCRSSSGLSPKNPLRPRRNVPQRTAGATPAANRTLSGGGSGRQQAAGAQRPPVLTSLFALRIVRASLFKKACAVGRAESRSYASIRSD